jgi:hypothetical protein
MTSGLSYSAHTDFWVMLLNSGRELSVFGTKTAQPHAGFIDICPVSLSLTKFPVTISFKEYVYAIRHEKLIPDIPFPTTYYVTYFENDKAMHFLLEKIRKKSSLPKKIERLICRLSHLRR